MCGRGSRFLDKGYAMPKPLIPVDGKPMFMKAVQSFRNFGIPMEFIFVIRRDMDDNGYFSKQIMDNVPEAHIVFLDRMTKGSAETAMHAMDIVDDGNPVILSDCDVEAYSNEFVEGVKSDLQNNSDCGRIICFKAHDSRYSYAFCDAEGNVERTAEKECISENAIAGSYYFSNKNIFLNAYGKLQEEICSGEMYVSLLYNYMIADGITVKIHKVDKYNSFGTPEELESYVNRQKYAISGHSGASLKIACENGRIFIRKSVCLNFERLVRQGFKQQVFSGLYDCSIPRILSMQACHDNGGYIDMEYVDGESFITAFDKKHVRKSFKDNLVSFLDGEFSQSSECKISSKIFLSKLETTYEKISQNPIAKGSGNELQCICDNLSSLITDYDFYRIPIGLCHGDLTLSNMIFDSEGNFHLIDFLDCFVESPMMDIAKLRQDTRFHWSFLMCGGNLDFNHEIIDFLEELDELLENKYVLSSDDNVRHAYLIMELLNLWRILPYASSNEIADFVNGNLMKLIGEFK